MRTRTVAAAVVFLAVCAAFLMLGPGRLDDRTIRIVDDVVFVALNLAAAGAAARTARVAGGRRRAAWVAMAVAMLAWALGDVLWTRDEVRGHAGSPSAADAAYLTYPAAVTVALLLFPTWWRAQSAARAVLDGVIVAGSLFIVSWLAGMSRIYHQSGLSRAEFLVALAYPMAAIVVLTVAAVVVTRTDVGHRLPMVVLTFGLACSALASGFFAYLKPVSGYASGHLVDLGWAISAVMVLLAAGADRRPDPPARRDGGQSVWASAWMPYVPLILAAIAIATVGAGKKVAGPVPVVGAVMVTAVLIRQYLTDRENRQLMRQVTDQALHDPLTGLANRAYFQRRMDRLTDRGVPVSVLALDLNDFKAVNDTYGHAAGDALLVAVAGRIQQCVRTEDTVARLGGDEFVILVEGKSDYAHEVAARLAERFAEPFLIAGVQLQVRFGLGIAAAESEAVGEELLRQADMAMYDTKRADRPRSTVPPVSAAAISS